MPPDTARSSLTPAKASSRLIGLVMVLFFVFGFCTVLVDSLIPKLKATFSLNYAEVMLTQFCFFGAYFVVSLPAAKLLIRIGFLQGVVVGLGLMALGCLLFTPAADAGVYEGFLGALFILASGVTIVQVAANPTAGDPAKAHARLTLAQAFNSLATTVGPLFGAAFIVGDGLKSPDPAALSQAALAAARRAQAQAVQAPFVGIALVLIVIAILCWRVRGWAVRTDPAAAGRESFIGLMLRPRLGFGILSIFVYVGAEVCIGSAMANYLMSGHTISAAPKTALALVGIYWGLAMVGRFIGAWALGVVRPALALLVCATGAIALVVISALAAGMPAAVAILMVGLCNSIMFPTIFTLAIEGLGERAAQASGLLSMAIVGGAVTPLVFGLVADRTALNVALVVPALCYAWIALYGVLTATGVVDRRSASAHR